MRAGGFTLQQTLATEAASILKHSLSLAKRRGHAQITPLHVAATLLSDSRTSLLKRACLKSNPHSNSHPLQCRALELCFNVALNRLPTTHPSSHLLHHGGLGGGQPCLSNALIAALKRAQAHQRRGCIENQQSQQQQQQQQQPLLAIKVELEQLIISILDDPSVSRVMREAGFSSISVKNNLEDLSISSSPCSVFQYNSAPSSTTFMCSPPPSHHDRNNFINNHNGFWQTHFMSDQNPFLFHPKNHLKNTTTHDFNESVSEREKDLRLVFEVFSTTGKRRNTVIVGDCLTTTEGLVEELMNRVQRSISIPNDLRSTHVLKFQFCLKFMKRNEVEMKVSDLRSKVTSLVSLGNGVIIYVGDLKWVVADENENNNEFLVEEIGRLISDFSSSKVWLLATANYQTYMKCQVKQPYSLEMQWFLQAVSVPSGGLGLSLHGSSGIHSRMSILQNQSQMQETKPFAAMDEQDKLTCCAECTSNFERDAGFFKSGQQKSSPSFLSSSSVTEMDKGSKQLPYWLQPNRAKDDLVELRRKWNRLCHSLHHPRSNQLHPNSTSLFNSRASSFPWWTSAAGSNLSQHNTFRESNSINFTESTSKPNQSSDSVAQFGTRQPCSIDFGFSPNGTSKKNPSEPRLDSLKSMENKDLKITLALGSSMFSDQKKGPEKEQDLCKLLHENIPWQSGTVRSIAEALLNPGPTKKNGNWLYIQGTDLVGKRRLARAISETFTGSSYHLVNMNMGRENEAKLSCRVLLEALKFHEKCIVLIEEIDFADIQSIKFLKDGFQSGRLQDHNGREISLSGATIVVMTSTSSGPEDNGIISMKLVVESETCPSLRPTESIHKRKAESELPNKRQSPRTSGEEKTGHTTKVFSRQSSSNTLDLNVVAEVEDEDSDEEKTTEFTPVPTSDLIQETDLAYEKTHYGFFESIENRFVLDRNSAFHGEMAENLKSKINGVFVEVFGKEKRGFFCVDPEVLDQMVFSCGSFLADLFDKWLVDIFQTSLLTVKKGGGHWGTVRVTFVGIKKGNGIMECGYMGSNLPTSIQV